MSKRGKFIALEGGDGSGKTTALERLRKVLPADKFVFTREPGGDKIGEKIRKILLDPSHKGLISPLAELLLFEANRFNHLRMLVEPALAEGKHVITDGFNGSTWAYQLVARKRGWQAFLLFHLCDWLHSSNPDHWIWFDVDPVVGRTRTHGGSEAGRGEPNRLDREKVEFHRRVWLGYRRFFKRRSHTRIDTERWDVQTTYEVARNTIYNITGI